MKTKKHDTSWMVSVALMAAIVIVLANTPLGMIQLPIIKATTVHIPVILGAILLGPAAGAILGGVFGICCVLTVYEYYRNTRGNKSSLDFSRMQDINWCGSRMALDSFFKTESK